MDSNNNQNNSQETQQSNQGLMSRTKSAAKNINQRIPDNVKDNVKSASQKAGSKAKDVSKSLWDKLVAYVEANPKRAAILGGSVLAIILSFMIPVATPHVSLAGEPLLENGNTWLTNSILTTIIVDLILIALALATTRDMQLVPSGLQNLMETLIEYLYTLSENVAGQDAKKYFPWAATLFMFILVCNWFGLIPGVGSIGVYHAGGHGGDEIHAEDTHGEDAAPGGEGEDAQDDSHGLAMNNHLAMADGKIMLVEPAAPVAATEGEKYLVPLFRAPSADLNTTFALALATMFMVQFYGIRKLGSRYFVKFWNPTGEGLMKGINIFVGILELIGEISRVLTFAFRLFGNIFAGEVVLATMAFLIAFLVPLPFYALEILVGAIQALVFMMLALVFFSMATISHGDEHH